MARQPYMGLGLLVSSIFLDHTQLRHTTVGRTPLDEGPARRRDRPLPDNTQHSQETDIHVTFPTWLLFTVVTSRVE
jgi:hypothetical protein